MFSTKPKPAPHSIQHWIEAIECLQTLALDKYAPHLLNTLKPSVLLRAATERFEEISPEKQYDRKNHGAGEGKAEQSRIIKKVTSIGVC